MRLKLKFIAILLFAMPSFAFAQSTPVTKAPKVASGHDKFLSEFYTLLKKYPKAAAQFGLTDMSKSKKKPIKTPSGDARFACCDFPDLTPNTDADCITLCQL
jgi:hypothetical protein